MNSLQNHDGSSDYSVAIDFLVWFDLFVGIDFSSYECVVKNYDPAPKRKLSGNGPKKRQLMIHFTESKISKYLKLIKQISL